METVADLEKEIAENEAKLIPLKEEEKRREQANRPTAKIVTEIDTIEEHIDGLQQKLDVEVAEENKKAMSKLVEEQQETANELKKTSDDLIIALGKAVVLNKKLLELTDACVALRKQTGKTLVSTDICLGSQQALDLVHGYCVLEQKGQPPDRPCIGGNPIIQYL